MTQNLIQIGNSTGIIIPKALLIKLGLKPGEQVHLAEDMNAKTLTISRKDQQTSRISVTPDFFALLEKVNKHYGSALKELAKR